MSTSSNPLLKKFKLRKLSNMAVGGVLATTVLLLPFAWAGLLDSATYMTGVGLQKAELIAQQTLAKSIDQAQQELQNKLAEKANTLAAGLQSKITSAVSDKLGAITNGAVGKLMSNAGVTMANVAGPGVPGHVDPATTQKQMAELATIKNPVDAIAAQTKFQLENQLHDRLNVTSMLDEKPGAGTCKSAPGDKCTILIALREQDAIAMEDLQSVSLAAVGFQLSRGSSFEKAILDEVYVQAGTTTKEPDTSKVVTFLTPSHSIPLGFERNPKTAADLRKSMWLSQVMVGAKNDVQFLSDMAVSASDTAGQLDAMAKLAKVQLARSAIMNVHNENLHNSLNSQFRACVVRPDAQDRIGATQEQQLVHIQSLLRCGNMIHLQQRQQDMETQRLLGTMLLTLLDLYAVQEPGAKKQ